MKNHRTFYENIIIDSIDLEAYNLSNDVYLYDKIETTYNIFKSEYLYESNLKRYGTEQNCFKNWLQGLPSVLTVPFYNYEILKLGRENFKSLSTGSPKTIEIKEDRFLNNYWGNLASAFFTLKDNL